MSKTQRASKFKEEMSDELSELLKNQKQIKDWQSAVHKRITKLEDFYIKETTMGNIIRGFDLDASSLKEKADKSRRDRDHKYSDDKERMFSGSCYAVYYDRQQATLLKAAEGNGAILPTASTATATASAAADIRNVTQAQAQALALAQPTNKKARKGD